MDRDVDHERRVSSAAVESTGPPTRMTRQQTLTLISMASVNFSSMICYSILGPFFPNEAVKKGASQTVIGLIFGCYAVCNLIGALILGKYIMVFVVSFAGTRVTDFNSLPFYQIVQIGAKFMLVTGLFVSSGCTILFGLLDRAPAGPAFITMCFIVRSFDAVGFAAAMTSSVALTAKIFPNNVATVVTTRSWFLVTGGIATAIGFCLLGPVPFLHIPRMFYGPTVGGFLTQHLSFEWAAAVQGGLAFLSAVFLAVYYLCQRPQRQR
ncbi:MFS-type transporter SLC18B1 Solute carrier family 18 member B1 [Channa argus]|uniref:MFS-type transporter SLC18B1 Solute carrier family 18 member B1 n=1 Tax=Channa argus TaxID=215402 RepID=A0A6G1QEX2_CHAAH|nr:MFS-type transporter SLC18B1 Solute carrier family 18 member B1 [Channa argus]